jgi:hypothetical protein
MLNEVDTMPENVQGNSASYDPSDNKLRLYLTARVEKDSYKYLRSIGFVATPKQDCSFAGPWSVAAENACFALIPEDADIGDEGYSVEDRAADRAERFSGYRDKRRSEAGGYADRYESGPAVFGNQNAARAERQARRHERVRDHALSQWSKAEYWQVRTAGVIHHALHRLQPSVRRGRILRLEAEQRKHEKGISEARERFAKWQNVLTLPGGDQPIERADTESFYGIASDAPPAGKLAYALANSGQCYASAKHPDEPEGKSHSLYDLLFGVDASVGEGELRPLTPNEVARLYIGNRTEVVPAGSHADRWSQHYNNRLAYEKAMLEAEGGMAGDVEMVVGGFVGRHQILKINKSAATGRVVSVGVWGPHPWNKGADGQPVMGIQTINIERLGESIYRAPTELELQLFNEEQKALKKAAKATKPKVPSLINPTEEDAQRLQDELNRVAKAKHAAANRWGEFVPSEIVKITQAEYSAKSKGSYSLFETRELHGCGRLSRKETNLWSSEGKAYDDSLGGAVCKLRTRAASGSNFYSPQRIVVITDKPQKPIGIDWEAVAAKQEASVLL